MRLGPLVLLAVVGFVGSPRALADGPRVFTPGAFGGVGDGKASNTAAFAKAVAEAAKAGGGVVRVPAGKWLTGAVELRSNVTLDLEERAVLVMSTDPTEYPVVLTRWEGVACYNYSGLVFARAGATRVAVTGKGAVDGQGPAWWRWVRGEGQGRRRLRELAGATDDPARRVFGTPADALRPALIEFVGCTDVRVEGVTLRNAPMAAVHLIGCSDVAVRGAEIYSRGPGGCDGVNVESSRGVLVDGCTIECGGGDGVAVRAGRGGGGQPCEHVTVRNCTFGRGDAGVGVGPELAGGVRDVAVIGCAVKNVGRGVRVRGARELGGSAEDVRVSDLRANDVGEAVVDIDLKGGAAESSAATTRPGGFWVKNVRVGGLQVDNAKRVLSIRGAAGAAVAGVAVRGVKGKAERGVSAEFATGVTLVDLELETKSGPVVGASDVADWRIENLRVPRPNGSDPILAFKNAAGLTVRDTDAPAGTETFLRLRGAGTGGVQIEGGNQSAAKRRVEAVEGAEGKF